MGDYNLACALSHLSFGGGERVMYIPMIPLAYDDQTEPVKIAPQQYVVSSTGPNQFLVPLTVPIEGDYDHYGRLKNPVQGSNLESILKWLGGMSAKEFLKSLFDYEGKKVPDALRKVYGIWIRKDVWDAVVEWTLPHESVYSNSCQHSAVAKHLKYKPLGKTDKIQRFNQLFAIPGTDAYIIGSDGGWVDLYTAGYEHVRAWIHNSGDLKNEVLRVAGVDLGDISWLKGVAAFDDDWDEAVAMLNETVPPGIEALEEILEWQADRHPVFRLFDPSGIARNNPAKRIYAPAIKADDPEIKKLMREYSLVREFMFRANLMFLPTAVGPQYGDRQAERALAQISLSVLDRIDAENEDEDGEE